MSAELTETATLAVVDREAGGSVSPPTSQRTVRNRASRGDEEELYRAHADRLERLVGRAVGGAPAALVEDACAFAWEQLVRRQPERPRIVGWLYVVARREALRLLGREARDRPLEELGSDDEGALWKEAMPGVRSIEQALEARGALAALAALRERERRYLALRVGGHGRREIAALTGATVRQVDRHLARGRNRLRPDARRAEGRDR